MAKTNPVRDDNLLETRYEKPRLVKPPETVTQKTKEADSSGSEYTEKLGEKITRDNFPSALEYYDRLSEQKDKLEKSGVETALIERKLQDIEKQSAELYGLGLSPTDERWVQTAEQVAVFATEHNGKTAGTVGAERFASVFSPEAVKERRAEIRINQELAKVDGREYSRLEIRKFYETAVENNLGDLPQAEKRNNKDKFESAQTVPETTTPVIEENLTKEQAVVEAVVKDLKDYGLPLEVAESIRDSRVDFIDGGPVVVQENTLPKKGEKGSDGHSETEGKSPQERVAEIQRLDEEAKKYVRDFYGVEPENINISVVLISNETDEKMPPSAKEIVAIRKGESVTIIIPAEGQFNSSNVIKELAAAYGPLSDSASPEVIETLQDLDDNPEEIEEIDILEEPPKDTKEEEEEPVEEPVEEAEKEAEEAPPPGEEQDTASGEEATESVPADNTPETTEQRKTVEAKPKTVEQPVDETTDTTEE